MKIHIFILLALWLNSCTAQQKSQLIVNSPTSLVKKLEQRSSSSSAIDAVFANYGHIPYGQSILGNLYYNMSNPMGCTKDSEFTDFDFEVSTEQVHNSMILVDRGDCTFVTKTRNIARAGGELAIIVDNSDKQIESIIMSDDGTGQGLRIPSMIISQKDGQILKDYLKTASLEDVSQVQLTAQFEMANPDNTVEVKFWYTTNDDKSLLFVKDMGKYIQKADKSERGIEFEPKFVHWSCPHCDSDFKRENCLSDGKYCAMTHDNTDLTTYQSGKDVVLENLRQYCVYKVSAYEQTYSRFFYYVNAVQQLCEDRITESCHQKALSGLPFMSFDLKNAKSIIGKKADEAVEKVEQCISDSWETQNGAIPDTSMDDNNLLRNMLEDWNSYGHHLYPSVTINDVTFRGQLNPFNVFEAICAGFKDLPDDCKEWLENEGIQNPHLDELLGDSSSQSGGISKSSFIMIVSTLLLCNLIMIIVYRRNLDKEIKSEMKTQVSSAVSQYVALSQISELQTEGSTQI